MEMPQGSTPEGISQTKTRPNYLKTERKCPARQDLPPLAASDVAEILTAIPTRPAYPDWIAVIAAVGSVLTESEAAAVLSAWSPEESPGEYARKLRNRCQRVGIGSLIDRAKAHGFDASAFARRRADRGSLRISAHLKSGEPSTKEQVNLKAGSPDQLVAKVEPLPPMPDAIGAIWDEGVEHLRTHPEIVAQVDTWRAWPAGTAATLLEDGLLSSPVTYGKRGLAFPVQAPERCELGFVQTRQVGYHNRPKTITGQRVSWSFHPNEKQDGQATPALPFVIGAGFASFARTVIVTEGQWDAITLAAAAGWLANDASWPERIILFGVRGAGNWRSLWTHWRPFLPAGVAFVLFQDNDTTGDEWTAPRGFRDTLAAAGHPVRVIRSQVENAKDLNDVHRITPITAEQISAWLGRNIK